MLMGLWHLEWSRGMDEGSVGRVNMNSPSSIHSFIHSSSPSSWGFGRWSFFLFPSVFFFFFFVAAVHSHREPQNFALGNKKRERERGKRGTGALPHVARGLLELRPPCLSKKEQEASEQASKHGKQARRQRTVEQTGRSDPQTGRWGLSFLWFHSLFLFSLSLCASIDRPVVLALGRVAGLL